MRRQASHARCAISTLICNECGTEFPLPRPRRARERGHTKHIWCINCQAVTAHTEIRECDQGILTP